MGGGFSASFSSKDICRFCHAQYLDLNDDHIHNYDGEEAHEPWTIEEYDDITDDLDEMPDDANDLTVTTEENLFDQFEEPETDSSEDDEPESEPESISEELENEVGNRGLKSLCVFNKLKAFNCVTSMPPDCLHDLFEGVGAQDLLGIIRILKNKGWFSLENYNVALQKFQLSPQEASNKPQQVPKS